MFSQSITQTRMFLKFSKRISAKALFGLIILWTITSSLAQVLVSSDVAPTYDATVATEWFRLLLHRCSSQKM
jgi:hypothetical protein